MSEAELEELAELWTQEAENHLLIRVVKPNGYVIFDTVSGTALIIEDDEIAQEVVKRMLAAGVRVVDRLPKHLQSSPIRESDE